MQTPKRKPSRRRTRNRRAQWKAEPVTLSKCPQCGQLKEPHKLCLSCGYYKKRQVVHV